MAVMIAALMSDLDSIFNSASTIFTLDIYKMLRIRASSRELVVVGRLFVIFMVTISIAWVPVIIEMQGGQMYLYIQEIAGYLTPPIAALFLLGVFWKRCNETGAFWGGMTGFVLGTTRLFLGFVYREPRCDQPDERPAFITDVHYMYIAAGLFWISGLVAVGVSLCTSPPELEKIKRTTIWGLRELKRLPVTEREEMYKLTNGNGVLKKDVPEDVQKERCLDVADMKLLMPSPCDQDPETPSTEASTPMELYGNGHAKLVKRKDEGKRDEESCPQVFDWICQKEKMSVVKPKVIEEDEGAVREMLYEPPKIKLLLNLGLVLVCSLGVFMFVYFSL